MVLIVGFGNPLLDIIVQVDDNTILEKFNIQEDYEKEETATNMKSLLEYISHLNPIFAPGGCSQNTLRVFQWILDERNSTVMIGAIGDDKQGDILEKLVGDAGVHTCYYRKPNLPTGCSVVLTKGIHRTLIAHIGAAEHVSIDDVRRDHTLKMLESSDLVYLEGFFVSQRVSLVEYIASFCNDKSVTLTFNLCGAYMIERFPKVMWELAQKADIIIGNRREYETLITQVRLLSTVEDVAKQLCRNYENGKNAKYGKIVIITDGSRHLTCVHSGGRLEELDVPKIDGDRIKDTNGAGDAFAAGFLAGLLMGKEPLISMKWGCWVAQQIIQQVGCTTPKNYSAQSLKSIN